MNVCIDPGHGGRYPGAVGSNFLEKDLALQIAFKLKQVLSCVAGFSVIMTRESDVALGDTLSKDLKKRVQIANDFDADVFVSVHCNAVLDTKPNYMKTLYSKYSHGGKKLAEQISASLKSSFPNHNDSGTGPRDNIYVLKKTNMYAVLVEPGFISNERDELWLSNEASQMQIAEAIKDGIVNYSKVA